MLAFTIKRVSWAIVLAFLSSFFAFVAFFLLPHHTPSQQPLYATSSLLEQYKLEHKSVFEQYGLFVWRFVRHGDFGTSFVNGREVGVMLGDAIPVTLSLAIGGLLLALLMAILIGVLSALRPRSLLDRIGMVFVIIGVSAHPLWIGLILSYVFGFRLHVFPISGYCNVWNPGLYCGGAADWAYHLLLPWLTFALLFAALYARMIRATVIETLQDDYVRTAVAKGAGRVRVLRSHVLRNAMLPVVAMIGMDLGLSFVSALFVEAVFALPGVGRMLYLALLRFDMPVIMGVFVVVSLSVVLMNLVADLVCMGLDPRLHGPGQHRGLASRRPRRFMRPGATSAP